MWDDLDASVICRHLNISQTGHAMILPPSPQYNKSVFGVHCTGFESDPEHCPVDPYDYTGTCQWAGDAGVQCGSGQNTNTTREFQSHYLFFNNIFFTFRRLLFQFQLSKSSQHDQTNTKYKIGE